jgi:phage terminase Nu1 subunit (DNA packaging protein)
MGDQVTTRAPANVLGVSKKTIAELAKRGIIAPAGPGRYALEASVSSYCAHLREQAAGRGVDDDSAAKARLGTAKRHSPR